MSPAQPQVLAVVVAYGSERQLAACLAALGGDEAVVVVDNGRSEPAQQLCRRVGARYIRPAVNVGFAAAVNLALRAHRDPGTDVVLVNPDARLLPGDLARLRDGLHRVDDLAAVGPRLVGPDGTAEKARWPIPSPWTALAGVAGAADRVARRHFVSGAVLLLRGEALDALGPFDERFFLYAEESDWQLRALRAGWRVAVVPAATAVHVGGATSSDAVRRELLFDAAAERFARKWYGPVGWQVFRAASVLAALRRLITARDPATRATQRRAIGHYRRGPIRCAEIAGSGRAEAR